MGGGFRMRDAASNIVRTPNLTFHSTGLSDWTLEEFKRALTQGINKENKIVRYPMPVFPELTDEEIVAMYLYLKSVPPIKNEVK
jgi:hypothetical protein